MFATILTISLLLQFVAAVLSIRLIRITGRWQAWGLIALAMTLMGVRSSITLYRVFMAEVLLPVDLTSGLVTLSISVLMVAGVIYLGLFFNKATLPNEALQQREAQLADAQLTEKLMIFMIDYRDDSIRWSDEFYRLYGYEKSEFTPTYEKLFEFTHVDDVDRLRGDLEKLRQSESEETMEAEYRMYAKNGSEIHIHTVFIPEKDRTGQIIGCQCLSQNITEAKQLETRFRTIVENSLNALLIFDKQGRIIMANEVAGSIFGYEIDVLVGTMIEELIPERFRKKHQELRQNYMDNMTPRLMGAGRELLGLRQDGSEFPVEIGLSPLKDESLVLGTITDITERKQAEKALINSEKRYRSLIENSFEGIRLIRYSPAILIDLPVKEQVQLIIQNGIIDECNDQYARMYGYSQASDLVGKPTTELREETPEISKFIESFIANNYIMNGIETCENLPDGTMKYFLNTAISIIENGELTQTWGVVNDITERKQTEEALKKREEQLHLVMSVTDDGWYDWDPATNNVYFDPRYYTMAGYEPNEFPGVYEEWGKRVHPEDWVETEKAVKAFHVGEIPEYDVEFRFMRKDGEWMWIRARIKIISRDENGVPLRLVGTHTDITAEKLAKEELHKSHTLYNQAEQMGKLGHWEWDELTDRFIACSEQYANIFDMTIEQMLKNVTNYKDDTELIHENDRERYKQVREVAYERKEGWNIEYRINPQAGKLVYVHEIGEPVSNEHGTLIKTFGTLQDITDRTQAEKALLESETKNRAWLEKSMVCTKILDIDLNLQYMSTAGVQALNIDDITLLYGKPYPFDFYPESFKTTMTANLKKALETHEVIEQEAPVVDVDGNELWFHSTIIPVKDEKGENDYLMVLSLETTERKRAEQELHKSHTLYHQAEQMGKLGHWEWDEETNCLITCSKQYANIYGMSIEQMLTTFSRYEKDLEFILEGDRKRYEQVVEAAFEHKEGWDIEYRMITRTGTMVYVHELGEPVFDNRGTLVRSFGILQDITESKLAEEKIFRSEAQLREAQRIAHMGFFELDLITNINKWSDEVFRIYGLEPDEKLCSSLEEILEKFIPQQDKELIISTIEAAIEDGTPINFDHSLVCSSGEIRHVHGQGEVHRDNDGLPLRIFGTLIDITESKRANEELRESEKRLRDAQRIAHLGFWELNLVTNINKWSDEMYRICGLEPDDNLLPSLDEILEKFIPQQDRELVSSTIETAIEDDTPIDMQHSLMRSSGEIRYVHAQGEVYRDNDGLPLRVFGTLIDITESKQAEMKIRENEEKYRLLSDNLADVVWTRDMNMKLTYISPSIERMTGFTVKEKISQSFDRIVTPSSLETANQILAEEITREQEGLSDPDRSRTFGLDMYCKDGSTLPIETTMSFIRDDSGQAIGIAGINRDITERKQMEVALQQHQAQLEKTVQVRTAELSNANEELRAIAHTIAHDLKAPLRAVAGFSELLGDDYAQSLDTTAQTYLDRICGGAQRMSGMLDDLLQHATLGERKEMVSVDMAAVWTSVLQDLDGDIRSSGAEIILDGKLPVLVGHRPTLEVLLRNLLSNALKFAAPGVTPRIKLTVSETTVGWTLSLADNGIGMASKHLDSIFELFYKLHTREQYPGTGIGLALVRKAVQIHGGSIEVETNPGNGTTFHVTLPSLIKE
jgi:PAS domain S-box-containing protein